MIAILICLHRLFISFSFLFLFLFTSCLYQLGGTLFFANFVHVIRSVLAHSVPSFLSVPRKVKRNDCFDTPTHRPFAVPNNKPKSQKKIRLAIFDVFASLSTFGLYAAVACPFFKICLLGQTFRPALPQTDRQTTSHACKMTTPSPSPEEESEPMMEMCCVKFSFLFFSHSLQWSHCRRWTFSIRSPGALLYIYHCPHRPFFTSTQIIVLIDKPKFKKLRNKKHKKQKA